MPADNPNLRPHSNKYEYDDRKWYETRPRYLKRCGAMLVFMQKTNSNPRVIDIFTAKVEDARKQPYLTRILDITFASMITTVLTIALSNGLPTPIYVITMATTLTYIMSRKWAR